MKRKNYTILLIAFFSIVPILFYGQTASDKICLTPKEYRFFDEAVIDRQTLKKDTHDLKGAISDLHSVIGSLRRDSTTSADIRAKSGEKEAIYVHKIDTLSDKVDALNVKVIRNRRAAIVGGGVSILETALIILGLILIF